MARVAQASTSTSVDLPRFLSALKAVRQGDFSVRLPDHWTGVAGKVADTFNEVVEMNQRLASELERLHLAIGDTARSTSARRSARSPARGRIPSRTSTRWSRASCSRPAKPRA